MLIEYLQQWCFPGGGGDILYAIANQISHKTYIFKLLLLANFFDTMKITFYKIFHHCLFVFYIPHTHRSIFLHNDPSHSLKAGGKSLPFFLLTWICTHNIMYRMYNWKTTFWVQFW